MYTGVEECSVFKVHCGTQVLTQLIFFPSYLITRVSFLQPWLYRSPSPSFQLLSSENLLYSTGI